MFRKSFVLLLAIAALFGATSVTRADFIDDFESYTTGNISGQGAWVDAGSPVSSDVTNAFAQSGSQSLVLSTRNASTSLGSELVHQLYNGSVITSGKWQFSLSTYVPSDFDGFFGIDQYQTDVFSSVRIGASVNLDRRGTTSEANSPGLGSVPLLVDQWADVEMIIDLDADTVDISYNGAPIGSSTWNFSGNPAPGIGSLYLRAAGGSVDRSVYVDDLSLTQIVSVPEPSTAALGSFGLLALFTYRRRKKTCFA